MTKEVQRSTLEFQIAKCGSNLTNLTDCADDSKFFSYFNNKIFTNGVIQYNLLLKNNTPQLESFAQTTSKFTIDDSRTILQSNEIILNRVNNITFFSFKINQLFEGLAQTEPLFYRQTNKVSKLGLEQYSLSYVINELVEEDYKKAIQLDTYRQSMDEQIEQLTALENKTRVDVATLQVVDNTTNNQIEGMQNMSNLFQTHVGMRFTALNQSL